MDQNTLQGLKDNIANLTVCEDLKNYKEQVLTLIRAELEVVSNQIVNVTALTNPLTFIAKSVEMNLAQVANLTKLVTSLKDDLQTVTDLIEEQSAKIPGCSI